MTFAAVIETQDVLRTVPPATASSSLLTLFSLSHVLHHAGLTSSVTFAAVYQDPRHAACGSSGQHLFISAFMITFQRSFAMIRTPTNPSESLIQGVFAFGGGSQSLPTHYSLRQILYLQSRSHSCNSYGPSPHFTFKRSFSSQLEVLLSHY